MLQDETYNFVKKKTLAQMFSCEFCEIFENIYLQNPSGQLRQSTFFTEHPRTKPFFALKMQQVTNFSLKE